MSTTWYDIKLATLQKMFAAEGSTIPTDESTTDYIASMPYACNEALMQISTAGKFLIKSVSIAHFPVPNLIDDNEAKAIHTAYNGDTITFEADGVRSISMDILGTGTLSIYVDDTLINPIPTEIDSPTAFTELKENVTNESGASVKYVFTAGNQLSVKSAGMYACSFPTVADIPSYKKYLRYPMKDYASDFYQLDSNQLYYEGDSTEEYLQTTEFFQEGNKVLILPREKAGNYTIYYKAYPEQITTGTADDYVLPIDDEVATLIPLFMASELYKDDDSSIATLYRNEFEVAFERLTQKANVPVAEHFKSVSGWI